MQTLRQPLWQAQSFRQHQVLVGRDEFLSQVAAAVQDHTRAAAQVEASLHLQATHMEGTPAALLERSQLVAPLVRVVVERRMQAAVAAAFGAAAVALRTQAAVAVRRLRAPVYMESLTPLLLRLVAVQFGFAFPKQQRWLPPHSWQGRAGRVRLKSLGLFRHLMT
jgi:hypothetical protein